MNGLSKRTILALLFAAVAATSLSRVVYTTHHKFRIKIVNAPTTIEGSPALFHFFVRRHQKKLLQVLTIKARNDSEENQTVRISLNSAQLGDMTLPPNREIRSSFDVQPEHIRRRKNSLLVDAGATAIELNSVHLGNTYGSSRQNLRFVIVPATTVLYERPPFAAAVALFAMLVGLGFCFPGVHRLRFMKRIYLPLASLVFVLLTTAILLPFFSKYKILFSLRSFLSLITICYLPSAICAWRLGLHRLEARYAQARPALKSIAVVALVFLFFFSSMVEELKTFEGNYTGFLHVSKKRYNKVPFQDELHPELMVSKYGYDGQFFYLMAFDPLMSRFRDDPQLYRNIVDAPPFRYRRIGFSLLTKIVSLNQSVFFPEAMMFLLLAFHMLAAWILTRIAIRSGRSPFWALLYVLIPGFTISMKTALPEPISAALLLLGIYLYLRERVGLSALSFAFSLLVRETGVLVILVLISIEIFKKKNISNALLLAAAGLPHLLWRLFITWRLWGDYGMEAFYYEPGNLTLPFLGVAQLFSAITQGSYRHELVKSALAFPFLLLAMLLLALWALRFRKDFLTISVMIYSFIALSLNFSKVWVQVGNVERQSFESFVCMLVLFLTSTEKRFWLSVGFFAFFVLLFLYDWNFFTDWYSFRQGFMLKPVVDFVFVDTL